jgi:peptide/nickel transport system permease protein
LATLIAGRAVAGVFTLWVVSMIVFAATEILPGNPAEAILGRGSADPVALKALEVQLHLNESPIHQYLRWFGGILDGHLGVSLAAHESVWTVVSPWLANSATLVVLAGVIGALIAVSLGMLAAVREGGVFDQTSSVVALALTALPEFVVGILVVFAFATNITHLFPPVSIVPPGSYAWDHPSELVLPVATLVLVITPYMFRMTRGVVAETLGSEYVEAARLRGLSERRCLLRYALPNALPPIIQVIALNLIYLAGGIVLVESVFDYPGVGQGLVSSVGTRDIPVIQFIVLVLAAFYVVVNLCSDVLSFLASPRKRVARG